MSRIDGFEARGQEETIDFVERKNDRIRLRAWVTGTNSRGTALVNAMRALPDEEGGLLLHSVQLREEDVNIWSATATYTPADSDKREEEQKTDDPPRIGWSTSGGTTHITHSLVTHDSYVAQGETAIDFGGAINVESDSEGILTPKGTDIVIPSLRIHATVKREIGTLAQEAKYAKDVSRITGTMNDVPLFGNEFKKGELLFMGGEANNTGAKEMEVTLNWDASENLSNEIVSGITVAEKFGHDHLWVFWRNREDTSSRLMIPKAIQINVEANYRFANHATILGLQGQI